MGRLLASFALVALLAVATWSPGASGGEPAAPGPGVWVFDVKVAKVVTTAAEDPLAPPDWLPSGAATTTRAPWPDLVARLQKRGAVTLLMDQRATGLEGRKVTLTASHDRQIQQFTQRVNSAGQVTEQWNSSTLSSGATAELLLADGQVHYSLQGKWELAPSKGDLRPLLGTTKWDGDAAPTDGATMVFPFREQVRYEGKEPRGVEIYAFLTVYRAP